MFVAKALRITVISFFAAALAFLPSFAAAPSIKIHTQKHILDNGLTVLTTEMPESRLVTVGMMVKAGSALEGDLLGTGITHFLEHMFFKGTEKRGVGVISKEVQSRGGSINANTSQDRTYFTVTVPVEQLDFALDIIADMMQHPSFAPEEFEKEKEVVLSEVRLYHDRPEHYFSDLVFRNSYLRHPYRVPIIGFAGLLKELKREDLLRYYRMYYVPNNMILTVAGNIDTAKVVDTAKRLFNSPRGREVSRNLAVEPVRIVPQRYEEGYPTDLTRLSIAYPSVALLDKDLFALDVLSMILGQGESSRLYSRLFKKLRIVRSVSAGNFTPEDPGIFIIDATLDRSRVEPAIKAALAEIALVRRRGVKLEELARAKRQVISQHIQSLETAEGVAYDVANSEAMTGDPDFSAKYVAGIQQLTANDIQRAARKYLSPEKVSIVILSPENRAPGSPAPQGNAGQVSSLPERIVLGNGIRVILSEDHRLPVVSIDLLVPAGPRMERPEDNGLSSLSAQLFVQGTRKLNSSQLSREIEGRGIELIPVSGNSQLGLHFNLLSEDLGFALDIMEKLVKEPRLDPQDFSRDKYQALTAIQERDENIGQYGMLRLRELLFPDHPFRFDELGTSQTVEGLKLGQAAAFLRRVVTPKNMVIAVFGDIDKKAVAAQLKEKFSAIEAPSEPVPVFSPAPLERQAEKEFFLDKKQAMVALGFRGPSISDSDRYPLEIAATILGSPLNGRIFSTIRDQFGQAYTLGGRFVPLQDTGIIYFYVLTTEESLAAVKEALLGIVRKVADEGVTQEELDDAKAFLKGGFLAAIQTQAGFSIRCAADELYGPGYLEYLNYTRHIDSVSLADVKRAAGKYLHLGQSALVTLRPKK